MHIPERAYLYLTIGLLASIPVVLTINVEQTAAKSTGGSTTVTKAKPKPPGKPLTAQKSCHPNGIVPKANKNGTDSRAEFVFNAAFTGGVMAGAGDGSLGLPITVTIGGTNSDSHPNIVEIAPANSNVIKSTRW